MTNTVSLITCKVTGKSYIGVTKNGCRNPAKDFDPLRYGHGSRFRKAVRRYGRKAFTIRILGCGYRTRETLHRAERRFIKKHDTVQPSGYNVTCGGVGPNYGPEFCKSARIGARKRSKNPKWIAAMRRRSKNPKWKAAILSSLRRMHRNPRWLANVRAANHRLAKNPKWRAAMTRSNRRLAKTRKWKAVQRAAVLQSMKNPKWLAAVRRAGRLLTKNTKWRAAHRAATRRENQRRAKNPRWRAFLRKTQRRSGKFRVKRRKLGIPSIRLICERRGCNYREGRIVQLRFVSEKSSPRS
jgi:hypothetical protein